MPARTVLQTVLLGAVWCLLTDVAQACPGCKDALASQKNGLNIALGYQYSILFMMAMPFTLLGLFAAYMYWEIRRAQVAKDAEQAAATSGAASATAVEPVSIADRSENGVTQTALTGR